MENASMRSQVVKQANVSSWMKWMRQTPKAEWIDYGSKRIYDVLV